MYESFQALIDDYNKQKIPVHDLIIQNEIQINEITEDQIRAKVKRSLQVMLESIEKSTNVETMRPLPIKEAMGQSKLMDSEPFFLRKDIKDAVFRAMSIAEYSSGMGVIYTLQLPGHARVSGNTL